MPEMVIEGRAVGRDHPPLVIAEIGINHEGSLDTALAMAKAAVDHGAEAVKLQTHVVDDEMSEEARTRVPGNSRDSIHSIMQRCELSDDEEREVAEYVRSRGSIFLSTPFSRRAVDRLVDLEVPVFKIGSGECSNYPLVEYIARFDRPVIMSTGMHTIEEVAPSVEILRAARVPFALLHTTNLYPTPDRLVRLRAMTELADAFPDAVIGLSDHSESIYACLGAVALGACILERHFTDSIDRPGPDISSSMDPAELARLLDGSRRIHAALGGRKGPADEESVTMAFALSSVVALRDIRAGEVLSEENIWVMRPAGGAFGPADFTRLLGKRCEHDVMGGRQLPASAVAEW